MTANQARKIIYQEFLDEWDPPSPAVPIVFDNELMDADETPEWVRLRVVHTPGGQHTLGAPGGRIYRRRGAVVIEIFSAVNQGLLRLDELGAAALSIFEGQTLSQVMFNDGMYRELPSDGQWAKGEVSVLFTYDETK